jgi:hypothetical protein
MDQFMWSPDNPSSQRFVDTIDTFLQNKYAEV